MIFCHSMSVDLVVGTLRGGGDTQTLAFVIELYALSRLSDGDTKTSCSGSWELLEPQRATC